MKRGLLAAAFLSLVLFLPSATHAQEALELPPVLFGLGLSVGSTTTMYGELSPTASGFAANLYLPILIGGRVRLEPDFGYAKYPYPYGQYSTGIFNFGFGMFYQLFFGRTGLYFGVRVGLSYLPSYGEGDPRIDVSVGPGVGAEYYVWDHLSLGGELRFTYVKPGVKGSSSDSSSYMFSNQTQVFVRVYL